MRSCASCKFHSHSQRPRVVGVFDGDLEMIEEDETELEDVYACTHQGVAKIVVIGKEKALDQARDCLFFESGAKTALSPHLQRLLAQSEERANTPKDH